MRAILLAAASPLVFTAGVQAQSATEALRDVITITGTKRPGGVDVQEVPIAVTAYSADQLEALQYRDISSLSYQMPNVQLEDIGTSPGIANFSIRGLGINSSIPAIDPTVGYFVDGIYYGLNAGIVVDNFDLEAIEVLRGPQGVLFGRNVTGGAMVLRTTTPTDEFRFNGRIGVETGLRYVASAVVSGPLTDILSAKLAVYRSDDDGWHTNQFDGSSHGANEVTIIRPALALRPNDNLEFILRLERGKTDGDGPSGQNHVNGLGIGGLFPRGSFGMSIDEPGFARADWNQAIFETNIGVEFGNGTITNILGWRDYEGRSLADIDATPAFLFHAPSSLDQTQWSNELRYAGTFGNVDVTTGFFYFDQTIEYVENRLLLGGALNVIGGGTIDHSTWGVFANFDIHTTDRLTFNVGARYSVEDKDARIQSILPGSPCVVGQGCNVVAGNPGAFIDSDSWTSFAPRVGVQFRYDEASQIYASWSQGYRSGGYNFRNTSPNPAITPGPFDQERIDAFEVGLKTDLADGNVRLNMAAFWNNITDMQREINEADPITGVVQIIRNTADATIRGFEVEGRFFLGDHTLFTAQVGYLDGSYDRVLFDLTGDGVIGPADLALDIPRLAPWTYGVGLYHDIPLNFMGGSMLTGSVNYNYRDRNAYTDNNLGFFDSAGILDAGLSLAFNEGRQVLALYGKNLTDEATIGNDTQLPAMLGPVPLGGTFAPLNRGRVIGLELRIRN
ncbi:TonB-dependent receptor [Glycocaulis sp.]|uniref:TonB-dependent receptor n=1 Tax=Glycocaulis sp. TaxID=1969725 RepID=UPI0025C3B8BB|nr:TonB-dependent receptor [Glycocaulis sp.]MCH8522607.1 TonB-dependent receptor [Glycocaulis sp.]